MSEAGKRSFKNKHWIMADTECGCYYCLGVFLGSSIKEWVDGEKTPLCPMCGIDSVVPYEPKRDGDLENFRKVLAAYRKDSFS